MVEQRNLGENGADRLTVEAKRPGVTVTVSESRFGHGTLASGRGSARTGGGRLEITVPTAGLAGQSVKITLRAGR